MVIRKIVFATITTACIAGVSFLSIKYIIDLQKYKNVVESISINNVDLTTLDDGTYSGSFDALKISADVSVHINNHKITDIKLLHHINERGEKAEIIPQKVIVAQTLDVDTISGATNSSKVIIKAIENALSESK